MDHVTDVRRKQYLDLLVDRYCREALSYFQESPSNAETVRELAGEISGGDLGSEAWVVGRLRHTALPRLVEADLVSYDPVRDLMRYRGDAALEAMLERVVTARVG